MKKILNTILIFALATTLIVVGVFAANNLNFSTETAVSFAANDAFVLIEGQITSGITDGDLTYSQRTYDFDGTSGTGRPFRSVEKWNLGNITLDTGNFVFAFSLTFTNEGKRLPLSVSIARPATLQDNLKLVCTGTEVNSSAAAADKITDTVANVPISETTTINYMIVLTNYTQKVDIQDLTLNVTMQSLIP